jgi:dTDP-4-dehydrorhamnose reductase
VRIAVLGAGGQLGAAVVSEAAGAHDITSFTRAQLDVTDDGSVEAALTGAQPDAVVNCSGFNDVDAAEDQPSAALDTNAFAVRTLARVAERIGAALVHYGTDFVFDGTAAQPYRETDRPGPRSVYAASKMLGEWFALDAPRAYVLRVESLFGRAPGGPVSRGSVASIQNGLLSGTSPRVFEDRTVSPTYVLDAARATLRLLELRAEPGLYHCVNAGSCTWLEFARELARLLKVEPALTSVKMADATFRAQRPQFCALSNEKLARAGVTMPGWRDALERHVRNTARDGTTTG